MASHTPPLRLMGSNPALAATTISSHPGINHAGSNFSLINPLTGSHHTCTHPLLQAPSLHLSSLSLRFPASIGLLPALVQIAVTQDHFFSLISPSACSCHTRIHPPSSSTQSSPLITQSSLSSIHWFAPSISTDRRDTGSLFFAHKSISLLLSHTHSSPFLKHPVYPSKQQVHHPWHPIHYFRQHRPCQVLGSCPVDHFSLIISPGPRDGHTSCSPIDGKWSLSP